MCLEIKKNVLLGTILLLTRFLVWYINSIYTKLIHSEVEFLLNVADLLIFSIPRYKLKLFTTLGRKAKSFVTLNNFVIVVDWSKMKMTDFKLRTVGTPPPQKNNLLKWKDVKESAYQELIEKLFCCLVKCCEGAITCGSLTSSFMPFSFKKKKFFGILNDWPQRLFFKNFLINFTYFYVTFFEGIITIYNFRIIFFSFPYVSLSNSGSNLSALRLLYWVGNIPVVIYCLER